MRFRPLTAMEMPRFAGIPTFFRLPHVSKLDGLDIGVLGIPFDGGQYSQISGARFGPRAVRIASARIRTYNPSLNVDPYAKYTVADCGDVIVNPLDLETARTAITSGVRRLVDANVIPMCVGGDHSISLPILRAIATRHKPVGMIHFDAHSDTAQDDLGVQYGHGTPFRRAIEEELLDPKRTIQIGLRGSMEGPEELDNARAQGIEIITLDEIMENGLKWVVSRFGRLRGSAIYVSLDMDVLDPAYAPATGPNPGGLAARELIYLVRRLVGQTIVGGDVVEIDSPYDSPAGATCVLAAQLLYEVMCAMAVGQGGDHKQSTDLGVASRVQGPSSSL
jgi:agmatinase